MMDTRIINGKALAELWLTDIGEEVRALGVPLGLAAVYAEGDASLAAFVRAKQKAAQATGIEFSTYAVPDEEGMRSTLQFLAADEETHGIFVELPLPAGWDRAGLLALIPTEKDVDLLSPAGERAFANGSSAVLPPSVSALRRVLDAEGIALTGLRAAVVGQGVLVGKPIALWLRRQGAEVQVIDIDTTNPGAVAAAADVLVCGVGKPGLVTGAWVKSGATVIDFGYGRDDDGTTAGDVEAGSVKKKAGAYTPVPGGMGPLVVAAVLENLVRLATR